MANNDMIQAKAVVDDLTKSFEAHAVQIKMAWDNLEKYSKGITELPSEVKAMMGSINSYNTALTKEQEILQRNLKTYRELQSQKEILNRVTSESTARMNDASKSSTGWFSNMSGGLKQVIQLFGVYSAAMLAHRVIMKTVGIGSKLSDDLAQLSIYLKNNSKAADEVFASLTKIKTRTSLSDLLGIAEIVAKKGVVQNEIKGITQEFDKMFLVLGDKLGDKDTAIASVVKLISIFNSDGEVTKGRVKDISDGLQYLTTTGVATGDYLIRFSERLGAVRSLTGQTMPEILGLGAGFEQLGLKAEVASNATGQIIAKLLTDLPKYSKMAGIPLEEFKNLMETDSTEGLIRFAEGIEKNSKNAEQFSLRLKGAELQGVRVKSVLAEIAINGELLRAKVTGAIKAVENMNKTFDSSSLKQKTFAATLDQINKQFERAISSERVQDIFSNTAIAIYKVIEAVFSIPFNAIIGGLSAWASYKLILNKAIIANSIAQNFNNAKTGISVILNKIATTGIIGRDAAEKASLLTLSAKLTAEKANLASLLQKIIVEEAAIAVLVEEEITTGFLIAEQEVLLAARRENIVALSAQVVASEAVIVANEAMAASMSATGIGAIAVAIGLVVYGLYQWANAESEVEKNAKALKDLQEVNSDVLSGANDRTQKLLDKRIAINEDYNRAHMKQLKLSSDEVLAMNKKYEIESIISIINTYRLRLKTYNDTKKLNETPINIPKERTGREGDVSNQMQISNAKVLEFQRKKLIVGTDQNIDNAVKQMQKYQIALNKLLYPDGEDYNASGATTASASAQKQLQKHVELNFKELQSALELRKALLESEAEGFKEISEKEGVNYEQRVKAREDYSKKRLEIIDVEAQQEQTKLLEKSTDDKLKNAKWQSDELEKNKENYNNNLISKEVYYSKINDINAQFAQNNKDIDNRYRNETLEANVKWWSNWKKQLKADLDATLKMKQREVDLENKVYDLQRKYAKDKFKDISEDEKMTLQARQNAFLEYKKLAVDEINLERERKLLSPNTDDSERKVINAEANDAINRLDDSLEGKSPFDKAKQDYDDYLLKLRNGDIEKALNDIGFGSLNIFFKIEQDGQTAFGKMLEQAKKFGSEFAVIFQVVGDVAQDVFNRIADADNQRYASQFANLEKQRDDALVFAGDNEAARLEIQQQFDEKRKEIERRQFKAKKQQAIFNIAIDTAQALARQLAATPLPLGTGFLLTIAALGAAQIATVANQKVPEFYVGTKNAPEGIAKVDERGAEIRTDKYGNIKSLGSSKGANYQYLEKGDIVHTAEESKKLLFQNELQSILNSNGMIYSNMLSSNIPSINIENKGSNAITDAQVSKIVRAITDKPETSLNFDNGEFKKHVKLGHTISVYDYNRANATPNQV